MKRTPHPFTMLAILAACCVTETIRQSNEADVKSDLIGRLSFCTDGKTLVICTSDDGCISVNLPAEHP